MQDPELDAILNRRRGGGVTTPPPPVFDDELDAIVNRRQAQEAMPEERPPLLERIKETGKAIFADPGAAAKSIGKGLLTNARDLGALATGDFDYVAREIAKETARGEGAGGRILSRGVGAASLVIPAARVGGAATSALVNAGANAGLGAAQTPEDPMLGAVLGAGVPLGAKLAGKVTGGTARAALNRLSPKIDLDGVADDVVRGLDDTQRNAIPKRRTSTRLTETIALDDIGGVESVNKILAERTPRQLAGLDASVVQPRQNPLAPAADAPIPETFLAELDGPRREAMIGTNARGERTTVIDPEVKADRVTSERLDVAEQRAAEKQMVSEVKEIEGDITKAQGRVERTSVAAEKAAQREADALEREQAKMLGLTKEYNARKAVERLAKLTEDKRAKADAAAQAAAELESASGMLGRANAGFTKSERAKNAARAALARRRGVQVDTPEPPVAQAIPEPTPAPVAASQGILEPPVSPVAAVGESGVPVAAVAPAPDLPPAPEPFVNWRTLGVDPSKPDALSMSASARIQAAASRPDMVERLAKERGRTTFDAMNAEAQKSWAITQLGIDPLAVDSKKLVGLSGAQIHALKAPLLENAGLMESIAREMIDLEGDDLVKATQTFEALERSNDELLATIQREGSARGRDLGALRQMANMTTDPAVWLIKAKKVLGDQPMTASIQARIMKLAKEATEACGGG